MVSQGANDSQDPLKLMPPPMSLDFFKAFPTLVADSMQVDLPQQGPFSNAIHITRVCPLKHMMCKLLGIYGCACRIILSVLSNSDGYAIR